MKTFKISAALLVVLILFVLVAASGCSDESVVDLESNAGNSGSFSVTPEEKIESEDDLLDQPFEMEKVGQSESGFLYFRDTTTDVLYLWRKAGYGAGLTVVMNPESGLPMTYTEYMAIASSTHSASEMN